MKVLLQSKYCLQENIRTSYIFAPLPSLSAGNFLTGQMAMAQIISLYKTQLYLVKFKKGQNRLQVKKGKNNPVYRFFGGRLSSKIYLLLFERHCCQENKTSYWLAVLLTPAYREGDLVSPTWSQRNENLNNVDSLSKAMN